MRIGVPRETKPGESRVAATPKTVERILKLGYEVGIEKDAGAAASFPDAAYQAAGAEIVGAEVWDADVVIKINPPSPDEVTRLRRGQVLVGLLAPALDADLREALAAQGVTALAMDAVPRISRAQSLDVLSSMANLGGYRAVIEAAHEYGSVFTGQVTAAGKVPPAKVLVVGAGVAGLAAIGTANSLGAIVRAFDARPEVGEQVESMGAEFLRIDVEDTGPSADGYLRGTTADFDAKAAALYAEQARDVDIVVTTALIPGKPAPRLLTEQMVASMRPGSVVVDMAASNGGNVAGSRPDEKVVTDNGVTILGYTDLPGRLLDLDDVVIRGMTVVREGEMLWPPPPVQVSAAPAAAVPARVEPKPIKVKDPRRKFWYVGAGAAAFLALAPFMPESFLPQVTVFALAIVIGYYVIGNVHHALHTPLMSETNAISGVIVVGALLQLGTGNAVITALAVVAVLIASINVFGGFLVTYRMLNMFRKA